MEKEGDRVLSSQMETELLALRGCKLVEWLQDLVQKYVHLMHSLLSYRIYIFRKYVGRRVYIFLKIKISRVVVVFTGLSGITAHNPSWEWSAGPALCRCVRGSPVSRVLPPPNFPQIAVWLYFVVIFLKSEWRGKRYISGMFVSVKRKEMKICQRDKIF